MACKIVVIGDVNGAFRSVFKKVAALHAKNAFAFAIVVGNLFADPQDMTEENSTDVTDLINGKIEVALSTYFALGNTPLPEAVIEKLEASSGEVCDNLIFLGKRTTIKTSEGIRIVALGGVLDPNIAVGVSKDKYPPFYSEGDAKVLKGANKAHILITSSWPSNIRAGSKLKAEPETKDPVDHTCIAELCTALRPKYHFSRSAEIFYEREPFFHPKADDQDPFAITRFISLAPFGNAKKQKWIYAFSLDLEAAEPLSLPAGTTPSPLTAISKKRPALPDVQSYRFANDGRHQNRHNKRHKGPPTPAECFFCLSNSNVATHLITSIGEDVYMTTAKGPLTTTKNFPRLGFPCHMLIIPLTHSATLAAISEDEAREKTYTEMCKYRDAMNAMLSAKSEGEYSSVTWEVSRSGGIHTHWQYLPVPTELLDRGLVEAAFKVEAQNEKYPSLAQKDIGDGASYTSDFFRLTVWSPSGGSEADPQANQRHFVLPVDASFRFDVQFGRRVLAKLLGLESRLQWKDCGQMEAEETADAEAFKTAFKAFDFSLDD